MSNATTKPSIMTFAETNGLNWAEECINCLQALIRWERFAIRGNAMATRKCEEIWAALLECLSCTEAFLLNLYHTEKVNMAKRTLCATH